MSRPAPKVFQVEIAGVGGWAAYHHRAFAELEAENIAWAVAPVDFHTLLTMRRHELDLMVVTSDPSPR